MAPVTVVGVATAALGALTEELAGLQPAGRAFVARIVAEVKVDFVQGTLLLQAARILDDLQVWQIEARTNPKAARLAIAHAKAFAALLQQASIR